MQSNKLEAAQMAVAVLLERLPHPTISDAMLDEYAQRLQDVDAHLLGATVEWLIENETFFPTIAKIKQVIRRLQPDGLPEPEMAWAEVRRQMQENPSIPGVPCKSPVWSTPLIKQALEAVASWSTLCAAENLESHRARFIDAYRVLLERKRFEDSITPKARALLAELEANKRLTAEGGA